MTTAPLKKVGVIGWPVDHSLSPAMHNAAFQALGMTDWFYDRFAVPPDIVKLSLRELKDHGFIGVNVTVPHKRAVMPYVKCDPVARAVGAVNTIDFRTNVGTNTDVLGFMADLAAHDIRVRGERVIVLGAGGAARAAVYGLKQAGAQIVIANRTPEKAEQLACDLEVEAQIIPFDQVGDMARGLIVNCTPVGMRPHEEDCPLPSHVILPEGVIVYDMIYRPAVTALMKRAQAAGGRGINGIGMLVRQGAAAFKLWTGVEPPVDVMFQAVQEHLGEG